MNSELEELERLRRVAQSLLVDASRRREAALAHWTAVERPALKEQAAAFKSSEAILLGNVRHLEQRLESHFSKKVVDGPRSTNAKVYTGFNPIQSRAGPDGAPLPLPALVAERERLRALALRLESESAECRADMVAISPRRREREGAVWETRLIALADTLRVVLAEVAAVEVELAGREAAERLVAARRAAEASGAAALHRARAEAIAARVGYNRARRRLHFPELRGYNITFGGAGVYGATKDICISELRGTVRIELQPPERPGDPATLVMEGSAPRRHKVSKKMSATTPKPAAVPPRSPETMSASVGPRSSAPQSAVTNVPTEQNGRPLQKPGVANNLLDSLNAAARGSTGPPISPARTPARLHASVPETSSALPLPAPERAGKSKKMALKFLARLGTRRDKYQSRDPSEEVLDVGKTPPKSSMKSLASKLLGRKSKSYRQRGESVAESSPMGSLAFGEMSVSDSIHGDDETEELASSELVHTPRGDELPSSPLADLAEALQRNQLGDGSLASSSSSSDEGGDGNFDRSRGRAIPSAEHRGADLPAGLADAGTPGAQSTRMRKVSVNSQGRGGWLRNAELDVGQVDEETDDDDDDGSNSTRQTHGASAPSPDVDGIFVRGRTSGFELVGEKGTKVPNLSIGQADVEANVFVRFSFQFTEKDGWQAGALKPLFDVQHLKYSLVGNNVPMPTSLIRAILRNAIPGLIQRRLQAVLPHELGTYLLRAGSGVSFRAAADCVGVPLATLDADLGFEVRGPSRGAREAAKQQRRLAAAREARRLLGLSLPQAQALGRVWRALLGAGFGGSESECPAAIPPHASRHLSIALLIAFVATHERQPSVYDALCRTLSSGWAILQRGEPSLGPLDVRAFLDGPVADVRRKPARARVIVTALEAGLNVDALLAAMHDYTRRALEELFVNGPLPNASDGGEDGATQESIDAQFELLRAWHAWVSREMSHFKAKFCGASATLLGAANHRAFTLGVENGSYEGALRLRLPAGMDVDADGALSFECPLPSPEGKIGQFMDIFKALTVPSHLRPPMAAVNWIPLSGEPELDMAMREQVGRGVGLIADVLDRLERKFPPAEDDKNEPATTALSNPRTLLGSRLGRFIINRLSLRVRLDERRIGQILKGMDSTTMGDQFLPTTAGILGALGDVVSFHFCPARGGEGGADRPSTYLLAGESSDISRLRADVQSLGYQSGISPAGAVRLVHALGRAFLVSFKGVDDTALDAYTSKMEGLYSLFSREGLDVSLCWDAKAAVERGDVMLRITGRANDEALRETSPLVAITDLDLVPLGKAMRGDPPSQP